MTGPHRAGSVLRCRRRAQVDPEGQDPSLNRWLGVPDHGEVHEVGLGLLLEPLAVRPFDGRQAAGPDRVGPGPEPFHHGLRVELSSHALMVPVLAVRYE